MAEIHTPRFSRMLAPREASQRTITCRCGWVSPLGYDNVIKPAFAAHKREANGR